MCLFQGHLPNKNTNKCGFPFGFLFGFPLKTLQKRVYTPCILLQSSAITSIENNTGGYTTALLCFCWCLRHFETRDPNTGGQIRTQASKPMDSQKQKNNFDSSQLKWSEPKQRLKSMRSSESTKAGQHKTFSAVTQKEHGKTKRSKRVDEQVIPTFSFPPIVTIV